MLSDGEGGGLLWGADGKLTSPIISLIENSRQSELDGPSHRKKTNKATQETPTISTNRKAIFLGIGRFVRVTVDGLGRDVMTWFFALGSAAMGIGESGNELEGKSLLLSFRLASRWLDTAQGRYSRLIWGQKSESATGIGGRGRGWAVMIIPFL